MTLNIRSPRNATPPGRCPSYVGAENHCPVGSEHRRPRTSRAGVAVVVKAVRLDLRDFAFIGGIAENSKGWKSLSAAVFNFNRAKPLSGSLLA